MPKKSSLSRSRARGPVAGPAIQHDFIIAGVGASAGGLKAFRELLEHLPADPGLAFVLIPHLSPQTDSILTSLLQKSSRLEIEEAVDGKPVLPNHVYVISPNSTLGIADGKLHAIRPRIDGPVLKCIDYFFTSLAEDVGSRAVGIVLSGTASDGSEGLRQIKKEGGVTFAQDDSAEYASMPEAAAATGVVDHIMSPKQIAEELVKLAVRFAAAPAAKSPLQTTPGLTDAEIHVEILKILEDRLGVEFSKYKAPTVSRRVARRMALCKVTSPREYRDLLERDPNEVRALYDDLLINVTSFFREPETFEFLQANVFPELLRRKASGQRLRLWVPGCSTGEEPYSLAMALIESMESTGHQVELQIFASDVDDAALEVGRAGTYAASTCKEMSDERFKRFFVASSEGTCRVIRQARDAVLFAKHDLTRDPPFSHLDMISCRNLLIYLGVTLQKRVFPLFHYALDPAGVLVLGNCESTGEFGDLFKPLHEKLRVYEKLDTGRKGPFDFVTRRKKGHLPANRMIEATTSGSDASRDVDRILLGQLLPVAVIVNAEGRVLDIRGDTGPFLRPAPGRPDFTLRRMARQELLPELDAVLREAVEKDELAVRVGVPYHSGNKLRKVNIRVLPVAAAPNVEKSFIVLFEDLGVPEETGTGKPKKKGKPKSAIEEENARLRQALETNLVYQQRIQQKIEASNEELRAAHEEAVSANEEFQSTNEELETAKEELQSTNEELLTLNEELRGRNQSLAEANSDVVNVLDTVQIPIAIVDGDLRIRRLFGTSKKLLNALETDIGRKVTDLKNSLGVEDLDQLVTESMTRLTTIEREVRHHDGNWYLLRIRPYRTLDNRIDGGVLVLVDIDAVKKASLASEKARTFAEAVIDTVRDPLLILNSRMFVSGVNEAFYRTFDLKGRDVMGRSLFEIGGSQWNIPRLRELLDRVAQTGERFHDFNVVHIYPRIGRRSMLFHAKPIPHLDPQEDMILLTMVDVTERADAEEVMARQKDQLESRVRERTEQLEISRLDLDAFSYSISHDLRAPLRAMSGYAQTVLEDLVEPGDDIRNRLKKIIQASKSMDRLIQDLLAFSRLSKTETQPEPVDLGVMTEEVIRDFSDEIEQQKAVVVVERPLPWVNIHRASIKMALRNIMSNALKFTSPGRPPRIQIRFEPEPGLPRLWIEDNGIGMEECHLRRIFHVFERLNPPEEYPGSGIGLALARKAVEKSGAQIGCESSPGKGSKFWIQFGSRLEAPR